MQNGFVIYDVLQKILRNLHLQHNGILVRDLYYYFNVFLDADCTFKLRLKIWNVQKNRTLEDLPGIGTEDFLTLRHSLENICETQVFSAFLTQVHLIYL